MSNVIELPWESQIWSKYSLQLWGSTNFVFPQYIQALSVSPNLGNTKLTEETWESSWNPDSCVYPCWSSPPNSVFFDCKLLQIPSRNIKDINKLLKLIEKKPYYLYYVEPDLSVLVPLAAWDHWQKDNVIQGSLCALLLWRLLSKRTRRCLSLSLHFSRTQSMVWKSS